MEKSKQLTLEDIAKAIRKKTIELAADREVENFEEALNNYIKNLVDTYIKEREEKKMEISNATKNGI